jgi:hypothetical protein
MHLQAVMYESTKTRRSGMMGKVYVEGEEVGTEEHEDDCDRLGKKKNKQ